PAQGVGKVGGRRRVQARDDQDAAPGALGGQGVGGGHRLAGDRSGGDDQQVRSLPHLVRRAEAEAAAQAGDAGFLVLADPVVDRPGQVPGGGQGGGGLLVIGGAH